MANLYRVTLGRTNREEYEAEVVAETEEEAENLAIDEALNDESGWYFVVEEDFDVDSVTLIDEDVEAD